MNRQKFYIAVQGPDKLVRLGIQHLIGQDSHNRFVVYAANGKLVLDKLTYPGHPDRWELVNGRAPESAAGKLFLQYITEKLDQYLWEERRKPKK